MNASVETRVFLCVAAAGSIEGWLYAGDIARALAGGGMAAFLMGIAWPLWGNLHGARWTER